MESSALSGFSSLEQQGNKTIDFGEFPSGDRAVGQKRTSASSFDERDDRRLIIKFAYTNHVGVEFGKPNNLI